MKLSENTGAVNARKVADDFRQRIGENKEKYI